MALARELGVAAAFATGRDRRVAGLPSTERVRGLAWVPAGGALVGGAAALAAVLAGQVLPEWLAAVAAVAVLRAGGGGLAGGATIAVGVVEVAALLPLGGPARAVALVIAPLLARWAGVVQCYGGVPRAGAAGMAALAGRVGFREFAIASVGTLGATLVLLDAVGLAVAVASALVTLGVRTIAYRGRGGLDDATLNATSALVETSALVVLAVIGSMLGRR
jgi:hypothetical protein